MMSRAVVTDYVFYSLEKHNLEWPAYIERLPLEADLAQVIRELGDEFELRYNRTFQDISSQIHLTPGTAYQAVQDVMDQLFNNGICWGRIVALLAFAGSICVQCVEREMPDQVGSMIDWVSAYIDNNLETWIAQNGLWEGLVTFSKSSGRGNGISWPSFSTICGVAAIGALTIGALLQKS